ALLAGVALLALTVGPVAAADLSKPYPVKAPIIAVPTFSWTGFYLGANIGYAFADADAEYEGYTDSFSTEGFIGGVQIGYNYQFDNKVVLGVEADIEFGNPDDNLSFEVPLVLNSWDSASYEIDYFASVRARLGYAFDHWLPYVTGGVAFGKGKGIGYDLGGNNPTVDGKDSPVHVGWVIGAGLEYAITDNWTVRGEYLYYDLGSEDYSDTILGVPVTGTVDLKIQTVRLGVNYKF
ncbi:MAG: outer membrane protein, partial [Xanthobacteraceae bacterium]